MSFAGMSFAAHRSAARLPAALPRALALALAMAALALLGVSATALAAANPGEMLIYMPYGLIHSLHPTSEVDESLAEVASYDIGQVVFAMPKFKSTGILKLPRHNAQMLAVWGSQMAAYNAEHATDLTLTAVFNGKVETKKKGLDLEDPATRANIVSAVESSLGLPISGVQLDLEPYPETPGLISLLEELDATFARVGFHGRLSVTAPATIADWTPSYMLAVSRLVSQIDPLYYDSESKSIPVYESWVENSLAYYTANVWPATRIVPVLPSYSADRWHLPSVENITTATAALSSALAAGSRVNGAGICSGWGFLLNEEGAYEGSADRATWQSTTVGLAFSP
jgi:hypothetical protein